jgi:pimeloyl-ACP methyl ester carboxylesterase
MSELTHQQATINGIQMHLVTAGPAEGPLVILLHGFPEFWYGWRQQIPVLAAAGYRVVAPDHRGYNTTDNTPPYDLVTLTDDIIALIHYFGRERAIIVGHDWGGAVAWYLTMREPQLVEKLVVLNAPHGLAFREVLRRSPAQMLRSWYMFAFQLKLMDSLLRRNNYQLLEKALTRTGPPDLFEAELPVYWAAWSQPGAIAGMVGWYRAMFKPMSHRVKVRPKIERPVLLIWGTADHFMRTELAEGCRKWVPELQVELLPGVSHWVQHEAAGQVNALLLEYLANEATPQTDKI